MVVKIISITLPEKQIEEIDNKRGDITRSKYISRRLDEALKGQGD